MNIIDRDQPGITVHAAIHIEIGIERRNVLNERVIDFQSQEIWSVCLQSLSDIESKRRVSADVRTDPAAVHE